jgi:hypothetical protein
MIGFFLVLGTIYRFVSLPPTQSHDRSTLMRSRFVCERSAYYMFKDLKVATLHEWRREAILGQLWEFMKDFMCFLEALITIATLYNAIGNTLPSVSLGVQLPLALCVLLHVFR